MSFSDPKFKFIVTKIGEAAGLSNPSAAEDFLPERTLNSISDFVKGSGNGRLTFLVNVVATLQSLIAQNNSVLSASDLADPSGKRTVSVGAEKDLGSGRYLYFFRTQSSDKTSKDFEITFGEIKGSPIETLNLLLTEVYLPSLESTAAWGKCSDELWAILSRNNPPTESEISSRRCRSSRGVLRRPSKAFRAASS